MTHFNYDDIKFHSLRSVLESYFITPEQFMEFAEKQSKENCDKIVKKELELEKRSL